jgi:hypothetical protein
MSSSASSSGYNSAAQSVEMETSSSFYTHQQQANMYALYSPQIHLYSQHAGQIPPSTITRDFSPHEEQAGNYCNDWSLFNGGQQNMSFTGPSYFGQQPNGQYGQS